MTIHLITTLQFGCLCIVKKELCNVLNEQQHPVTNWLRTWRQSQRDKLKVNRWCSLFTTAVTGRSYTLFTGSYIICISDFNFALFQRPAGTAIDSSKAFCEEYYIKRIHLQTVFPLWSDTCTVMCITTGTDMPATAGLVLWPVDKDVRSGPYFTSNNMWNCPVEGVATMKTRDCYPMLV